MPILQERSISLSEQAKLFNRLPLTFTQMEQLLVDFEEEKLQEQRNELNDAEDTSYIQLSEADFDCEAFDCKDDGSCATCPPGCNRNWGGPAARLSSATVRIERDNCPNYECCESCFGDTFDINDLATGRVRYICLAFECDIDTGACLEAGHSHIDSEECSPPPPPSPLKRALTRMNP